MKKIVVLVIFTLTSLFINAQPNMSIEQRLKMVEEKICKPLSVSKDKNDKILSAFKSFFTEVDKISVKGNRPDRSKIEAFAEIRDRQIKAILTVDQYQKYLKLESETRPKERK
jgi:hypothetical protein